MHLSKSIEMYNMKVNPIYIYTHTHTYRMDKQQGPTVYSIFYDKA